jgi:ABC-type transport system involved in multi-copper enzyme maturation permease subunit
MTAQTITRAGSAQRSSDRRLAGLGALLRKDLTEWSRGRRAWVIAIVTTVFMTLTAANMWITTRIATALPEQPELPQGSFDPLDNLVAAVGAQVWVLAAIFAVGSLIVAERQAGTLSWVASKPVARGAIWVSKWVSASAMLALSAVVIPMAATAGLVWALYGVPSPAAVVGLAVGMAAVVAFFAAVGLTAGTLLPGQPAVIAAGFGVFAVIPMLAAILPFDVAPFLPTSMLQWVPMLLAGEAVPWVTPVAYAIATAAVAALGVNRLARMEL